MMKMFSSFVTVLFLCPILILGQSINNKKDGIDSTWQKIELKKDFKKGFKEISGKWNIYGDIAGTYQSANFPLRKMDGDGILVSPSNPDNVATLITNAEFEDVVLSFDFMLSKGSKFSLFLLGQYQISLDDIWGKNQVGDSYFGGVGTDYNYKFDKSIFLEPQEKVEKAPGLWQNLKVQFKGPTFNPDGVKQTNAKVVSLYLNGVLVQSEILFNGPSVKSMKKNETGKGPILFQKENGGVAIRNIQFKRKWSLKQSKLDKNSQPIIVNPESRPYLLRSYLQYGEKKITRAISVGTVQKINYSFDLDSESMLQVWKGRFVDANEMWQSRGEPQLARPLGALVVLSDFPQFVSSKDDFDKQEGIDFNNLGYSVNQLGLPVFKYDFDGIEVEDYVTPRLDSKGLSRKLTLRTKSIKDRNFRDLFVLGSSSKDILKLGNNLYDLGSKYFISIGGDNHSVEVINRSGKYYLTQRLNGNGEQSFEYSIIW